MRERGEDFRVMHARALESRAVARKTIGIRRHAFIGP